MRYVSYEEEGDSLSESETLSDLEVYRQPTENTKECDRKVELEPHPHSVPTYLQPTISSLSKGKGKEGDSNGVGVSGAPRDMDDPLPRGHHQQGFQQQVKENVQGGLEKGGAWDVPPSGRPRSSQRRQQAMQSLKDRDRSKRRSAKGRERKQEDNPKGKRAQEQKRRVKQVRFQGDENGSDSSRSGRQARGKPGRSEVARSSSKEDPVGPRISPFSQGRLWNDAPQTSEDLYSSFAADIRAVFDRALTDGDELDAPQPSSAPPSHPLGSLPLNRIGNGGIDVEDSGAAYYRREEEELEKKSMLLRRELQKVEESKMQLELVASQKALKRQAKEKLEDYERELSRSLEGKIRNFMEEKERKVGEIREFRAVIDSKLQMLRQVLGELQTKEEHLETAYAAAIGEIHQEYRTALEARAKGLESEVSSKLRMMVKAMATKRKGPQSMHESR
ncbi:hypothetical protein HOP50_09g54880 [Chloropicon primus]|uniref:Uncharacterized protein n=1 Tax=Chloropicon primus TaxID=1764295 RepID=A0A5B8MQF9_9CHLO|nr:hypothetical protein A3770_09p54560 [Chloropicon primus]UPR02162.1 hypothetical protein HOP50_09g54880 [Chloropicon primus]|eukprot:QDZ22938.1 hypothetical protein A3770_09p54560 [Chloropicon primus]